MLLGLTLMIGFGLAIPQDTETSASCESAREEEYLTAIRDDDLKAEVPELFVHAIECLGKLKSVAAVNPLMDLLNYRRDYWWDGTGVVRLVYPTGRYPAGGALARIGSPALPSLIKAIAAADADSVEFDVLFYTLVTVFRNEQEEGLSFIKKSAIAEETFEGKERLLAIAARYAEIAGLKDR